MTAPYAARVTTLTGAVVECIARGTTAGCALTNLRRQRCGDWTRIEVGYGTPTGLVVIAEVTR